MRWMHTYSGEVSSKQRLFLFVFLFCSGLRHSGAKVFATCTTRQLGKARFDLPRADLTSLTSQTGASPLHRVFAAGRLIRPCYLVAIARSEVLEGHMPAVNLSGERTLAAETFTGHLSLKHRGRAGTQPGQESLGWLMSHLCQATGSPVWLEERSACLCLPARISSCFLCQLPKMELKQTTELSSHFPLGREAGRDISCYGCP